MPPIEHLVEADLYADDLEAAEKFYDLLGIFARKHFVESSRLDTGSAEIRFGNTCSTRTLH